MKKLMLATASVVALSIAGSGIGYAAGTSSSSTNLPESSAQTHSTMPQNAQSQSAPVNLSETQIKQAQEQLKSAGLYKGTPDGKMGAETKQAVSQFQEQHGLTKTGTLDQETLAALNNQGGTGGSNLSGSGMQRSNSSAAVPSTTPSPSH